MVKLLLEKNADVNAQDGGYYGNALQAASAGGHEQVVKLLLEKGANISAQDRDFGSPSASNLTHYDWTLLRRPSL
jgi:ankyrin repeat protein